MQCRDAADVKYLSDVGASRIYEELKHLEATFLGIDCFCQSGTSPLRVRNGRPGVTRRPSLKSAAGCDEGGSFTVEPPYLYRVCLSKPVCTHIDKQSRLPPAPSYPKARDSAAAKGIGSRTSRRG